MNLTKGMYIRTRLGIGLILDVNEYYISVNFNDSKCTILPTKTDIKKASYNLIDLIEQGDYVNGYLVTTASNNTGSVYVDLKDGNGLRTKLYNDDIETVLTRERFENYCYRVKEDENDK